MPDGSTLDTPILIPSVSSKGYGLKADGLSEAASYLALAASTVTEALLVSAYDLHHGFLPDVDRLLDGHTYETPYAAPALLVIDSGGFELSSVWDAGELYRYPHVARSFTADDYETIVRRLPTSSNILIVTYDHAVPNAQTLEQQITEAHRFRSRYGAFLVDFLLKPTTGAFLDPAAISKVATSLTVFDVIGVTESELGDSALARATAIRALRNSFDDAGVEAPIHVFGVLDPVTISYYFMAGAELFDGLTWTRYGIYQGLSVYRDSVAILAGRPEVTEPLRGATAQLEFLDGLVDLKRMLQTWAETGDFTVFGDHSDALRNAYTALEHTSLEGRR